MILLPLVFAFLALDLRGVRRAAGTARPWVDLALAALGIYFFAQPYIFLLALAYAWGSTPEQDRAFALLCLASVAVPGIICPLCAWSGRHDPEPRKALRLAAAVSFGVFLLVLDWAVRVWTRGV